MAQAITDNLSTSTDPRMGFDRLSELSRSSLRSRISALHDRLLESESDDNTLSRAMLKHVISRDLITLGHNQEAWEIGREAFLGFLDEDDWQSAAEVCDTLYQTAHENSLGALAQGIWLSLHRPITAATAAVLLFHLLQEMPEESQEISLIAATILFLSVSRPDTGKQKRLIRIAGGILIKQANHEDIQDRKRFEQWLKQHSLDQPNWFLPKLHNILFGLIQDDWWFDHDHLGTELQLN